MAENEATEHSGNRLFELTKEWSVHDEDILQVVGTGQIISSETIKDTFVEAIVVTGNQGNQTWPTWSHFITVAVIFVSVWFIYSSQPLSPVWKAVINAFTAKFKQVESNTSETTSDKSPPASLGTIHEVIVGENRDSLSTDETIDLPLSHSASPRTQIVMVPDENSTATSTLGYPTESARQLTMEAARQVVTAANIMDEALEESGRPRDHSAALNWAMSFHRSSSELEASRQQEYRQYAYDSWQRETDRDLSEQRHQEQLDSMEQDGAWVEKLVSARDRCLRSINTAIVRGVSLVAASRVVVFLMLNPSVSYSNLFSMLVGILEPMCSCSDISEEAAGFISATFQYISFSYFFISEQSGWTSLCHVFCVAKAATGITAFLACCLALRWIGIPSFVITFLSSAIGCATLSRNIGVIVPDLARLICTQAILSIVASTYTTLKFWSTRRRVRTTGGSPSSAFINEALLAFDNVNTFVHLSPLILVSMALLGQLELTG